MPVMMWRGPVLSLSLSLLLAITATSVAAAATTAPPEGASVVMDVRIDRGRLSVQVQGAQLADVLRVIGERGGFAVEMLGGFAGPPVTMSFTDLPLEQGIRRLALGYSSAFMYQASDGRPGIVMGKVWIFGSTPDRQSNATSARSADDARERLANVERVRALARTESVEAVRVLEGVLANEPEPRVRRAAVRVLGSIRSEEARRLLEAAASSDPDDSVRQAARALAKWRSPRR